MARVKSAKAVKSDAGQQTPRPDQSQGEKEKAVAPLRKAGAEQPRGDAGTNITGAKPEIGKHTQHPLGKIFPRLNDKDREELIEDIRKNGLRDAITVTPDGEVLDGWERYQACLKAGVRPRSVETELPPEKWAGFVISKNMMRRT